MTTAPGLHLAWKELHCWNRLGVPFLGIKPGGLVAPYPTDLRPTRGMTLGRIHERIRQECCARAGREVPLILDSAYRTYEYDKAVGGASSWHVKAGAMDLRRPELFAEEQFYAFVFESAQDPLSEIGGLGRYDWGCHVDCRPRGVSGVARWDYRRG